MRWRGSSATTACSTASAPSTPRALAHRPSTLQRRIAAGEDGRRARRRADRGEGPRGRSRLRDRVRRPGAGRTRPPATADSVEVGPPAGRRRDRGGQDEHARLRLPRRDRQPRVRTDPQPVGAARTPLAGRRADRRPRSRPGSCRCARVPTAADRSGSRRRRAASPASSPRTEWCRAATPRTPTWGPFSTRGPMARTFAEIAYALDVVKGLSARDLLSFDLAGSFADAAARASLDGVRGDLVADARDRAIPTPTVRRGVRGRARTCSSVPVPTSSRPSTRCSTRRRCCRGSVAPRRDRGAPRRATRRRGTVGSCPAAQLTASFGEHTTAAQMLDGEAGAHAAHPRGSPHSGRARRRDRDAGDGDDAAARRRAEPVRARLGRRLHAAVQPRALARGRRAVRVRRRRRRRSCRSRCSSPRRACADLALMSIAAGAEPASAASPHRQSIGRRLTAIWRQTTPVAIGAGHAVRVDVAPLESLRQSAEVAAGTRARV